MNIKIAHFQGGELSGNIDGKVRHSISSLSDYHFVCTSNSKRILNQKVHLKNIFNTGCPSIDLMKKTREKPHNHINIFKNNMIVDQDFDLNNYIILINHPDTNSLKNTKKNFKELLKVINYSKFSYVVFLPNSDPGTDEISKLIRQYEKRGYQIKTRM